ncbi:MAG: late competence development ComFB family protein [Pseudomonadota bacterium]|nr:late competence development ComFB family protein [Pseudomonadota bacterium]
MSINNNIRNYYEQLVAEEIHRALADRSPQPDMGYMADIACVALNRLPPRYIRFEVDMAFYMTPDELAAISASVRNTVSEAISFVDQHGRDGQET